MNLSLEILNEHLIVTLKGELDHHTSEEIRKKVDQKYLNKNLRNIVLDLSDLKFMDSSGIGLIMGRYKNCKERNGSISIISTNPYINRMLNMSGLPKIIKIYSSRDEAIRD
ncbi:anti-sigma F factor antagonist [Tepidimicrobium xylanilyticum]|uniref:Anti-sigma F factor antagonist n=1 Tax=Tepidimicrobium xylanilyticum TaxID=1123352 RepID=A0A1H2SVC3_9FIRM|nr:anti-sigma F factor antagonist [Tepidimicrobium xylanilyticum]GMG96106.1 anti-sigma F factor antagonist [Tepidimicrobium xylanilyticum]SDW35477.1 anti-anti-sigma regulatory factor, SpoIIAA [Tepidimicrobium xylanilyticum]